MRLVHIIHANWYPSGCGNKSITLNLCDDMVCVNGQQVIKLWAQASHR